MKEHRSTWLCWMTWQEIQNSLIDTRKVETKGHNFSVSQAVEGSCGFTLYLTGLAIM